MNTEKDINPFANLNDYSTEMILIREIANKFPHIWEKIVTGERYNSCPAQLFDLSIICPGGEHWWHGNCDKCWDRVLGTNLCKEPPTWHDGSEKDAKHYTRDKEYVEEYSEFDPVMEETL
jgi:hypothetical protein